MSVCAVRWMFVYFNKDVWFKHILFKRKGLGCGIQRDSALSRIWMFVYAVEGILNLSAVKGFLDRMVFFESLQRDFL